MAKKISDLLPETEILAQLAEEASELAQAVLKLRRALDGTNPTPKSANECENALIEEYADVVVCISALNCSEAWFDDMTNIADVKRTRWLSRLEERERKKNE